MKKLLHFLALAAMLCIPWVTQAQSPLTIGTGTDYSASGSSADGQGSPMGNTYYYNSAAQFIYTAEELASMGGAKAITSVAFYHNANSFSNNIKIYLAHTTATTVDPSSPATTPTLVYSGTGVTIGGSSEGWQTFTFDDPFNYNGTDNLLVVVCRVNNSSGYNSSQKWQYTETTDNKFMVRHADNTSYGDITNTSNSYTASTKRPNIQIAYAEPATCFKPQNLAATLTPGNGTIATLTWERHASGTEDAWVLEYGTASDFTGATSVNVTGGTPSKDLTNLNAEQTYYARVKADCGGGDVSDWSATCEFTPTNVLIINIFGTTGSTSSYLPSHTNYDFAYTQQIYTAAEMGSFPCTLQSVAFKGNNAAVCDLDIYLVNTTKSSFTGTTDYIDINDATLVFSGEVTFTANDWTTIAIDDFDYTGGNLAVIVDDNSGNWDYSTTTWQTFNTTTAQALYFFQDNTNINPSSPSVSSSYNSGTPTVKNQIKFVYELPSPYQKPQNLAVTNLTATGATITWEAPNSDVLSYKYQYREDGGTWSALTSTTSLSASLTGLTGNTTYEFQVQALYAGDNESAFASTSFTTPCDAFSVNPTAYTYGFEDVADMDCWTLVNGVTNTGAWDNATMQSNFGYEPARTGDNVFMFYYVDYDDTDPEYQTLISPELTDIPSTGLHVEFYYVGDMGGGGQETFRVGYSTTDNNLSSFTWGNEITNASTAYQRFSANYPAGTKYVAIQHTSDDQYYLFIDDITFEGAAACLEPTAVAANNITTTGAEITWTNGGEETAWDIFVTNDNTVVPDDLTTPTVAGTSTKPYPLTGLTHSTTYYVYVRSACSSTEHSAWSTPLTFHTECEGMDLPYSYGFEDGALSVCWNVLNTNTSYNSVSVNDNNANANTGTHSLNFFRGSTTGDLVAVLPEVGAYDLSDYQFEFSAKGTYAGYEITVGIMTDPDDLTTFVPQGSAITTTTSYAEYLARFNEYTGSGKYVAIKVVRPSTVTYGNIYIDDIAINPLPSCIEPDGLTVSNEAPHGATFEWTENGTATAWQLYISENNTAPSAAETNVIAATSNPFTLTTGLDPETDYYVWVRANCGSTDGKSIWVGPETFQTTIACPAPTGLAASNITNHTADLAWTGTSDEYIVSYRTAAYTNGTEEDFSSAPDGWIFRQGALNNDGTASLSGTSSWTRSTSNDVFNTHMYMNLYSTKNYWLITPSLTINDGDALSFDLAYTPYSNSNPLATGCPTHRFAVLISTDNMATWTILREWNNSGSAYVLDNVSQTGENSGAIDLSAYTGANAYIAFFGHSETSSYDNNFHFDNVTIGTPVAAGAWQQVTSNVASKQLTGLNASKKYEAKVQGDCGGEGLSAETASIFFPTGIPCPAPSGLTATNPKSNSIDLQWTNGGSEDWVVAYKADGETDFTEVDVNIADVTVAAALISYTLKGLDAKTDYTVKVRDNCEPSYAGDGMSEWTAEVPFGTIAACSAMDPEVSNITHHNATVTWDGESADDFTVNYRTAATLASDGLTENFESGAMPNGWTTEGPGTWSVGTGDYTAATGAHGGTYNAKINHGTTGNETYLITPNLDLSARSDLKVNLWYINREWSGDLDGFGVYYRVNGGAWNEIFATTTATTAWTEINEDLPTGAYAANCQFGFKFTDGYGYGVGIDDITIGTPSTIPAGSWQTQAATTTTADLTGLTAGTKYDVKVVPNCDEMLESSTVQFTTLPANNKYFLTAGDWATAANWMDEERPDETDNAIIRANATIPNGTVATVKNITLEGTSTLTLADGGQLIAENSVNLTVQKNATANSWMGIAAPVFYSNSSTSLYYTSTNLKGADAYDLMQYAENNSTWQSQKSSSTMSQERGYIYRRAADATLTFTGSTHVGNQSASVVTWSASDASLKGFNLIGNPYPHAIYYGAAIPTTNLAEGFYILQTNGTWRTVAGADINTTAIGVGEAIMVKASAAISPFVMTDVATAPTSSKAHTATLAFTVSNDEYSDVAYAMFSNGEGLPKMSHLNAEAPMLYIPTDEGRYAIAMMEESVESFPLNFNGYGEYTLSVNNSTAFGYLHLIDHATGRDIDLLRQSTYTFNANSSSDRFTVKLSPSTEENGRAIFVWQENGNVVVEGDGDLQVFDVMGRQTGTTHVDGTTTFSRGDLGMSHSGVYVLRLNGNSQKIVVK